MNRDEMLAAWLEGELESADCDRLVEVLESDATFAEKAAQQLLMRRMLGALQIGESDFTEEVLLSIQCPTGADSSGVIAVIRKSRTRQQRFLWLAIGVAAVLMLAFLGLLATGFSPSSKPDVAVLAAEGVGSLDVRSLRADRPIELDTGILEIALGKHARLVIEAPALFTVESQDRVRMDRGRCYAEMDKGKSGLKIVTPSGEVLDLGTRFGVEVANDGETAVHVFEGAVELGAPGKRTKINEGEGVNWRASGELEALATDVDRFVQRLPGRKSGQAAFLQWRFDEGDGNETFAVGQGFSDQTAAAQIHGAKWAEGVSGSALSFDGLDDWVETFVKGIPRNRDRTVACWLRLAPMTDESNVQTLVGWGLFDVKDTGRERGSVWELAIRSSKKFPQQSGRLQLNLGGPMTVAGQDLRDGRWHHVAAVSMASTNAGARGTILLYVDGELEPRTFGKGSFEIPEEPDTHLNEPVQFGRGVIFQHSKKRNRYFAGEIDEVFLIDAALTGDAIRKLMKTHQLPQ